MKKKQTKNNYAPLEKILTYAGLAVIALAIVATIFGTINNVRFIQNPPLHLLYYLRLIILLVGGFAVGYFITRKKAGFSKHDRLFIGVVFASFAALLYELTFFLQSSIPRLMGDTFSYPWSALLFFTAPLTALALTALFAYINQRGQLKTTFSRTSKITLLALFILTQGYNFGFSIYMLIRHGLHDDTTVTLLTNIFGYLALPLTIAIVSYLLLNRVTSRLQRVFYAVIISTLYATLTYSLWEFRTDASVEATNNFIIVQSTINILFVGILLWRARKAVSGISR